jgi:hypothetical protein
MQDCVIPLTACLHELFIGHSHSIFSFKHSKSFDLVGHPQALSIIEVCEGLGQKIVHFDLQCLYPV